MRKVCVTIIFDDYDDLKEPTVVTEGWKYIVISDKHQKSKTWKTKILKDEKIKGLTPKLKTGYVISQLHKILDFDIACLVGGQIQINTNLDKYEMNCDFLAMEHPTRNCVYEEAFACILLDKDNAKRIAQMMYRYKAEGMPLDVGMIQTGVTFRKNNKKVQEFCNEWWKQIQLGSHRDQLSFNYVNWKTPINYLTMPSIYFKNEFKLNNHKK